MEVFKISILVIVAIVTISFLIYCKVYKKHIFDNLSYSCYFNDVEVYQGENILFIEELSNDKYLPISWLKAELTTSKYLNFSERCSVVTYKSRFVSSCYTIEGNKSIKREWNICASKRGIFTIESVVLTSCDIFGINEVSKSIENIKTRVTVLPLEVNTPDIEKSINEIFGEYQTRRNLLTDVFSMRGIKEYTGHERLNRVHWKSSAKQSNLMVIDEDYTSDMKVIVYLYIQDNCEETIAEKTLSTACTVAVKLSEKNIPTKFDTNCNLSTTTSFGKGHALNIKRTCADIELSPQNYDIPKRDSSSMLIVVTPMINKSLFESFSDYHLILVRL